MPETQSQTIARLFKAHGQQKKMTAYAWSQYYREQEERWEEYHANIDTLSEANSEALDPHLQALIKDLYEKAKAKVECPICLETIDTKETLKTGKCGHNYHKDCIEMWAANAPDEKAGKKCPVCRKKY
jgi:ribosomal protein L37AE/L43A